MKGGEKITKQKNYLTFAMVLIGLAIIFSYSMGNVCAAGTTIYVNGSSGNDSWNGLNATHISGTLSGPKLSKKTQTST